MNCINCVNWVTKRVTRYADGTEVVRYPAPEGHGRCEAIGIETHSSFGCTSFAPTIAGSVRTETVDEAAWERFVMIDCPDCGGRGSHVEGGACRRCAGTSKVRRYDDGHVGEERTRKHPMEVEREKAQPAAPPPVFDGTALKPMPKPSVL